MILEKILENLKNIIIIVFIGCIIFLGYNFYKAKTDNTRLNQELIGQTEKFEKLSGYTAKLETQYKSQKELLELKEMEWKDLTQQDKDRIKSLTDAIFTIESNKVTNLTSDEVNSDYTLNEVNINGKDSPPIGYVLIKKDSVEKGNYKFIVDVKQIQTIDESSGKTKVYSKAFIIMQENGLADNKTGLKKWKDIAYPLPITGGSLIVDPTTAAITPSFKWWNPKFGLSASIGLDKAGAHYVPGLGVSLMSYGLTNADSKFKFINIGVNFSKDWADWDINFKPILYRPLDVFPNTFIFPGLGYSESGLRYLLGVEVGL